MKSITQGLIMTLAGLITLLTVGKVFGGTKAWIANLVRLDYGEVWVPVGLFVWFVILMFLLFCGSAYLIKQFEKVVNGKLGRYIGIR